MKRIHSSIGILTLSSSLLLTACLAPPATIQNPFPQSLAANAVTAPNQVRLKASTLVVGEGHLTAPQSIQPDSLIFAKPAANIKIGDIVMGRGAGNDFIRKVTQVTDQEHQVVLRTVSASLFEAIEDCTLRGFTPATPLRDGGKITLEKIRFNLGGIMDIVTTIHIQPDFSDTHIRIKDKKLFVRFAPQAQLDYQMESTVSLRPPVPVQGDTLPPIPPQKPVGKYPFTPVQFAGWVGPIPVVYRITPAVALGWGSQGSGKIGLTSSGQGQIKAGIELEAELGALPKTQTFSEQQFNATLNPPNLDFTGAAQMRLTVPEVQFDMQLAGIVGPYVRTGPYVDSQFQRVTAPSQIGTHVKSVVVSHLGAAVQGGISETTLFGHTIANGIHLNILDKPLKELYRQEDNHFIPKS